MVLTIVPIVSLNFITVISAVVFFKKVIADRGNILSEDGTILATSVPFYKIAWDATILDTAKLENYHFQDSDRPGISGTACT